MQFSLFEGTNLYRMEYFHALETFNLVGAAGQLKKWRRTFDAPPDLENKIEALEYLHSLMDCQPPEKIQILSAMLVDGTGDGRLQPLQADLKYLARGINRVLLNLLDDESCDFIYPGLHVAEVFIACADWDRAETSVKTYLKKFGEQSFVRQLLAFTLFQKNRVRSAYLSYTLALFLDPAEMKEAYLAPAEYRNKLTWLVNRHQPEQAWLYLPFALWQDGKTHIETDQPAFEDLLDQRVRSGSDLKGSSIRRFNWLLYLAEAERLRQQGRESERLFNLRAEMQKLNRDWFGQYHRVLKSFRNI